MQAASPSPYGEDEDQEKSAEPSNFNDGKGIKVSLCFTPLLLPLTNGKKCRKNAKATPENRVFFLHEDQTLQNLVDRAIDSINKTDKLTYCVGNRSGLFAGDNFTLKYTINCSDSKDIQITNLMDFANLINEIKQLNPPAAGFKLFMNDASADLKLNSMDSLHQEHGEDDDEDSDEDDQENPTKKKNSGPTPEELSQNENIARLTRMYACKDWSCKFTTCYPMPPDVTHIHLTHLHLNTWAAAIGAKENGVDLEHPPNTKLFDPTFNDPNDIALLSHHRLLTVNQNQPAPPSIIINNDFKDLAAAMQGHHNPLDHPPPGVNPPPSQPTHQPIRAALVPKMTLAAFCDYYELHLIIEGKLNELNITGPHALHFVSNQQLADEVRLSVGELADVRDAQERWLLGGWQSSQ
ncbi:hypothetical protein PILCRDRAFT_92599 [Piloderma croceum F 1598]|uniref:Uncharacterized protein n=1 Tax=Piloderma croceum (strain F 1598) TaxID=765440 RepID=A0A0C3F3B1_PILCF|nr:hypothetical protein PILCRDRAFT_92599 [Piloderma croceum F 1598]